MKNWLPSPWMLKFMLIVLSIIILQIISYWATNGYLGNMSAESILIVSSVIVIMDELTDAE